MRVNYATADTDTFDWIQSDVHITDRELEVLTLLSRGYTTKEIAHQLFLSTHTIESHKKNMIHKLDSRNTIDLVVKAIRMCIIRA